MKKTKNKNAMYQIDSCHEKIKYLTNDVCNKPSYNTVCYKPIVDRSLLTHSDYLKMLSTPVGFKWIDMSLYYKKGYNSYEFCKQENEKYNVYGQQKMNYDKTYNIQNNTINNQKQKKINDTLNLNSKYYKSKKLQNQRKNISQILNETMPNNANKTKIKNKININQYGMGDDLKNKNNSLIQKDEDDSTSEKLRKIKYQQQADYLMEKKKKLWLQAEKRRKKREAEENKFKSSIQAKQKKEEELNRNMEKKIKIKSKSNQILEEQRKQKIENEKEDMAKARIIDQKKITEEKDKLSSKEAERKHRLEALEKEEKEEEWRQKINQEFAQKMGYTMNSNIANKKNELSMCNRGNKILPQYTKKLLKEIKQNNQVFDPGNLMKQIIKRELNKAEKKKVKQKKRLQDCEQCNKKIRNMIMIKTEEKKEKRDLLKKIMLKKYYGLNNIIDSKNSNRVNQLTEVKSYKHCMLNKPKKMLKCKIPDVHCYSNTSFNILVCNWKNEVADMIANMQKRQYNCTK